MTEASPDPQIPLEQHFEKVAAAIGDKGPIGEVVRQLADGNADPLEFASIVKRHGVEREDWFRDQVADLYLEYVRAVVGIGTMNSVHQTNLRTLKRYLSVVDGELLTRRPGELSALLQEQLRLILQDEVIDDEEELYQVELQAALGLGYDDYLALVRAELERAYSDLLRASEQDEKAESKLRALVPIYRLASSNRRGLGALF